MLKGMACVQVKGSLGNGLGRQLLRVVMDQVQGAS